MLNVLNGVSGVSGVKWIHVERGCRVSHTLNSEQKHRLGFNQSCVLAIEPLWCNVLI